MHKGNAGRTRRPGPSRTAIHRLGSAERIFLAGVHSMQHGKDGVGARATTHASSERDRILIRRISVTVEEPAIAGRVVRTSCQALTEKSGDATVWFHPRRERSRCPPDGPDPPSRAGRGRRVGSSDSGGDRRPRDRAARHAASRHRDQPDASCGRSAQRKPRPAGRDGVSGFGSKAGSEAAAPNGSGRLRDRAQLPRRSRSAPDDAWPLHLLILHTTIAGIKKASPHRRGLFDAESLERKNGAGPMTRRREYVASGSDHSRPVPVD